MKSNYRKIWEEMYGPIPIDEAGRTYDIHHRDGNRSNNSIENLQCLSIEEHYTLHLNQKDYFAAKLVGYRAGKQPSDIKGYTLSETTKKKISEKLKGRKRKPETVEKISKKLRGQTCSLEVVEARRQGQKQYYREADKKALEKRWAKISEAHKGKIVKEETKEKLGKINAKLTDQEALKVHELANSKYPYCQITAEFGISKAQISALKHKKSYKWLWNL